MHFGFRRPEVPIIEPWLPVGAKRLHGLEKRLRIGCWGIQQNLGGRLATLAPWRQTAWGAGVTDGSDTDWRIRSTGLRGRTGA